MNKTDLYANYRREHNCCPQCGDNGERDTTTGPVFMCPDGVYFNSNTTQCRCGWVGIVHELMPEANNEKTIMIGDTNNIEKALQLLRGDLSYDNVAEARKILACMVKAQKSSCETLGESNTSIPHCKPNALLGRGFWVVNNTDSPYGYNWLKDSNDTLRVKPGGYFYFSGKPEAENKE